MGCGISTSAYTGPLNDVLRAALEHPSVMARNQQVDAARTDVSAATAQYLGRGNLIAEQTHYEGERVVGVYVQGQTDPLLKDDQITRYGVAYSLPVDIFGVISATREKAKNNLEMTELLACQERLLRLHQAGNAYIKKLALQAQADALRLQRKQIEASSVRVRKEVGLGHAAGIDLQLVDSEVAKLRADEARLQGMIEETRADLMDASGLDPEVQGQSIVIPEWKQIIANDALPVRLADSKVRVLEAGDNELQRSLLPSFAVGAEYYDNRGDNSGMNTWAVMARVAIPLDTSSYLRSSAEGSRALAAADERRAAQRLAEHQVRSLKSSYDSAIADAAALAQEISYRTRVVEVDQERWRLGAQTLENLLHQRRDLLDAIYRLADAHARAVAAWSSAQVLAGTAPEIYIAELDVL